MNNDPTLTGSGGHLILEPDRLLAGRYRVGNLLGIGGMGIVYHAQDEELGVEVALKVLRSGRTDMDQMRARFRRELLLARQVSHRNVVRIHDLGQDGDLDFITMDFVPGQSLREVLREGPLAPERALAIARQVAAALAEAHAKGVVHRDLKPANILVDGGGDAYITDFGIARSLRSSAVGLTEPGLLMGTPDYLAPEQARGGEVDTRTDLYAFGLLFFEMLTGELPFSAETLEEAVVQRLSGKPRTLEEVGWTFPDRYQRILDRCLAREPQDRYPDTGALRRDLEGDVQPTPSPPAPGARWRTAGLLLLAAVVITLVVVAELRQKLEEEPAPVAAGEGAALHHAVAVLPLEDETGREDLAWIAAGIAEMVATTLGESAALRVVPPRRVDRTLEDLKLDPARLKESELRLLAELLEVDRLITGSVRASGDRLRVEARLLDTASEHLVTSGELPTEVVRSEAPVGEAFSLIDGLGAALRQRLIEGAAGGPPTSPLSPVEAALSAYSAGTEALSHGDLAVAIPALRRAVEVDRHFPAGWARLAASYRDAGRHGEALEAARQAVEQSAGLGGPGGEAGRLGFEARALEAQLRGDLHASQQILTELVQRYPNDAEARLSLAEAYGAEGRFEEARRELLEVTRRDPGNPRAWFQLGRGAIMTGNPHRALDEYLVRALVIHNRLQDDAGRGDVLNAMGAAWEKLGDLDQAAERFREASVVRSAVGDLRGVTASLTNLATVDSYRGNYAAAESNLKRALEISQQLDDRQGMADLENQLGVLAEQRGLYREALDRYRQALKQRQQLGDQRTVAESYSNVGFTYLLLGEYDNAALYQQQARDLYQELEIPQGVAYTAQGLGQLALVRGDWAAASKAFLELLEASRELDLGALEGIAQSNLGRIAHYQGRYRAAFEHYRAARTALEPVGDPRGLAEVALFAAETRLELGMEEAVAGALEEAWQQIGEEGDRRQRVEWLRLEGERLHRQGATAEAEARLVEAEAGAEAAGDPVSRLRVALSRGRWKARERPRQGAELLRRVATEAETLGHIPLVLEADATLAEALLRSADPGAAAARARRALEQARLTAPYAGTFRLEAILARALEAQGEKAAAAEARQRGARELTRLRGELEGEAGQAFNRLPEVRALE